MRLSSQRNRSGGLSGLRHGAGSVEEDLMPVVTYVVNLVNEKGVYEQNTPRIVSLRCPVNGHISL